VVEDLRARNFTPGDDKCVAALGNSTSGKYMALMRHLLVIGQKHMSMVKLFLPPAEVLEEVDFESVKARYLDNTGPVLDWRNLETRVLKARSLMEEDTVWADGESTPDPTTLDDLNRRMLGIEEVTPVVDIEELSREALTPPEVDQQFFELVQRKGPLRHFGNTITVGTIKNPSSGLTKAEQDLVIDALNFTGRPRQDMYEHLIPVEELVPVFYEGRPIAFGAGREIDFHNNGTQERLEYLVATQVREGFYGRGLQTVVNGIYCLQRKGAPMAMMRSRSVGTIIGFQQHFSNVSFRLDTPDKARRAGEFSRFMGCECDEHGIVRNAYETSPHDPERDRQILEALRIKYPKRYNWVMTALDGLGPLDARIFQGRLTYQKKLRFKFDIDVLFRLSTRKKDKEYNVCNN